MPKTRNQSKNSLINQRIVAQSDLNSLINKCAALEKTYRDAKPGQASVLNLWGMFSSNIPNQARLNNISEVEAVINNIKDGLNSNSINLDDLNTDVTVPVLKNEIEIFKQGITQLRGVVLNLQQAIANTYSMRSPESNSELYAALKDVVDPSKLDSDAQTEALDAYKSLANTMAESKIESSAATSAI